VAMASFVDETWHKSMLRKEILKCDKNNGTFHTGTKKARLWRAWLFLWILINA